jgi:membrane protease YdiL (CAAX protease family)
MDVAVSSALVVAALVAIALAVRHADRLSVVWRFPLAQWRAIDAETARDPAAAGTTDLTVLVVLVTCAASLALQQYFGNEDTHDLVFSHSEPGAYWELRKLAWWSGWRVAGYVVLPMLVIGCLPGQRLADYHVSLRGFGRHLWIYALLFVAVSPLVVYASTTEVFRQNYPFYAQANRSVLDLVLWELLYAAQFVGLEFFFRGFLLAGLRRALGANAIFVMIVPYCMIHFGKPFLETIGAIIAGLVLGTLALRTRSIWGGVVIHICVAVTMDVLALRGCPPFGGLPCR